MPARIVLACLACAFAQQQVYGEGYVAAVRFAHYEVLTQQYANAARLPAKRNSNVAAKRDGQIADAAKQLVCEFVPKFLALALESPDDEAAQRCCEWIIVHCQDISDDPELYKSEAVCWRMMGSNYAASARLPALCLGAARRPTPAREQFLRALPNDYRQSVEVHGYAFLALAELLGRKRIMASDLDTLDEAAPAELRDYFADADPDRLRQESADLYERVMAHYREIPYKPSTKDDQQSQTLGQFAAHRLSQLESPRLARKSMSSMNGNPRERLEHLSGH